MKTNKMRILRNTRIVILLLIPLLFTCAVVTLKHPMLNMSVPSVWDDEAIIVLNDSLILDFKGGIKRNVLDVTHVTWYKINKSSPSHLKKISYTYNEYFRNKPQINIKAVYKDGKCKNIVNIKQLKDLYYVYNLYKHKAGFYILQAEIPNYSDLKYLRVSKKQRIKKPEECFGRYSLRGKYPILEKRINLIWPAGYDLNYGVENKENLSIRMNNILEIDKNVFTVECNNLNPIKKKNNKFPELWYSALFVSYPPYGFKSFTWKELGNHYLKELSDSLKDKDTSFLDSLARAIRANKKSLVIDKTFNFVKDNIRYYGSWEKAYAIIPRDPKTVFDNGYGDCKEMSTILTYLLRKKKVKAWLTLVNTSGYQYIEKYPTLGAFDHAIVCAKKDDGQLLYLDPTNKTCTTNSSYHPVLGQKVLVIKENASYTDVINPDPSYENKIITSSEVLPPSGTNDWIIKGKVQITGELAGDIFDDIKNRENLEESKLLVNTLNDNFKITAKKATLEDLNPLRITITYSADFSQWVLSSPEKGLIFSIPSLYTPNYNFSDLSYEGNRYLSKVEQSDTWIIPKGFRKYNFTNLNSSYAKGSWNSSKNKITRTYSCKFSHIDTAERNKLKKFFNERSNFERGIAWSK